MNPPALEKNNYNAQSVISNDNLLEQLKNLPSPSNSEPHGDNFLDTKFVDNNTYLPQANNSTFQNESNLIHFQKDQAPSSYGSVAPTEVKPEVKNLMEPEHQNPAPSNIPNSYTIYPPSKETEKIVQPPNYNYSAQPAPSYVANPPSFGISNGGENNQTNGFSEQRNNYGENNQEKIKNILSQYQTTSNTSTNSMNTVSTSNTPVTKSQSWNPNQTFNANPFVAPNSPVVQHPNANQVSNTQVSSQVEKIQQIEQNPYGYNQQKVLNPPPQYHPYPQSQPQSSTAQQVATFNNTQYTQTKEMLLQMQGYFEKIMKFMESVDQRLNNLESATKEILKNQQSHSSSTPSVTQSPTVTANTSYPSSTTSYPSTSSTPSYPTSTPSYPTTTSTPSYTSSSSPSYPSTSSTPSYPTTSYPSTNYPSTTSYPSLNSTSYPSVSSSVTSPSSPEIPINKYELEAAKKAQEQLDKDAELAKKLQSEIDTESKKSDKPKVTMQECPVCLKSFSSKELESHVEQCLAKFESTKKPDDKTGNTPANNPGFFAKLFGKNDKNTTTATPDNKTQTNTTATSPPKTNTTNTQPPAKPAQPPAPGPQPVPMYYPGQPQQGQTYPPYVMYPPNPSMVYRGNTGNTNIPNQQQGPYGPQMYPVQYVPVQPNMQGMQGQQPMYYYPPGTQFPQPNQQPPKK